MDAKEKKHKRQPLLSERLEETEQRQHKKGCRELRGEGAEKELIPEQYKHSTVHGTVGAEISAPEHTGGAKLADVHRCSRSPSSSTSDSDSAPRRNDWRESESKERKIE